MSTTEWAESCASCKFFVPQREETYTSKRVWLERIYTVVYQSYCRRYPQREMRKPQDWCGEYRASDLPTSGDAEARV